MAGAADVADTPGITLHEDAVDAVRRASGGLAVGAESPRRGVFVEGDSGCIGHISDASHTDQEEGCAEDFCGVQNPAGSVNFGDSTGEGSDDHEDSVTGYESNHSGYGSDSGSSTSTNTHALGGSNSDSGYTGV